MQPQGKDRLEEIAKIRRLADEVKGYRKAPKEALAEAEALRENVLSGAKTERDAILIGNSDARAKTEALSNYDAFVERLTTAYATTVADISSAPPLEENIPQVNEGYDESAKILMGLRKDLVAAKPKEDESDVIQKLFDIDQKLRRPQ